MFRAIIIHQGNDLMCFVYVLIAFWRDLVGITGSAPFVVVELFVHHLIIGFALDLVVPDSSALSDNSDSFIISVIQRYLFSV